MIHPVIYTALPVLCGENTLPSICCGFYFLLWTKHLLRIWLNQQDSHLFDYEVENIAIKSFYFALCSPYCLLLLSVP